MKTEIDIEIINDKFSFKFKYVTTVINMKLKKPKYTYLKKFLFLINLL